MTVSADNLQSLRYSNDGGNPKLSVLDQLLIPTEKVYIDIPDVEAAWSVIRTMQIRGEARLFSLLETFRILEFSSYIHTEFHVMESLNTLFFSLYRPFLQSSRRSVDCDCGSAGFGSGSHLERQDHL